MMRSVLLRTLYDRRYFILGWTLGLILLSVIMVVFFPAMRQDQSLDALAQNMPAAFQGLLGDLANLRDFDRYLASQLFDIRASMVVGIMAIIIGVGVSTREEDSGELRTVLSQPISRSRYLLEKWLAMVVIILIAIEGMIWGIYLTMPFIDDATIATIDMWNLGMMTALTMIAFATLTFAAGFVTGKKSVATLFGILTIVISYLITSFAAAVDWIKDIEYISLLHYFPAVDIVVNGISARDVVVLGGVTLGALVISWLVFRRRDLN